ncbi:MAG: hypothetical protein ACM3X0_11515 [Bacteroidota bacterium]
MRRLRPGLCCLAISLLGIASPAAAVPSTAPLAILNAYVENNGRCPDDLIAWNRKYNARTIAGEVSRIFYYRAIGNQEWGACGRPFFKSIFSELQKIWLVFAQGDVTEAEIEAKEDEIFNLMFAALAAGSEGGELVQRYEQRTTSRLMSQTPERQYFNCTFFGDRVRCVR